MRGKELGALRWFLPVVLMVAGAAIITVGSDVAGSQTARRLPRQFDLAVVPTASGSAPTAPSSSPSAAAYADADGSSPPKRVRIPALDVDAPVVPVGSSEDEIKVPGRPAVLGWWTGGPAPGSRLGTSVLVGHVDSVRAGPGALFHLDRIRPRQQIDVQAGDGRYVRYRVTELHVVRKTSGLSAALFDATGPPRLVLITCGGPFDSSTHNYTDNIVAIARQA